MYIQPLKKKKKKEDALAGSSGCCFIVVCRSVCIINIRYLRPGIVQLLLLDWHLGLSGPRDESLFYAKPQQRGSRKGSPRVEPPLPGYQIHVRGTVNTTNIKLPIALKQNRLCPRTICLPQHRELIFGLRSQVPGPGPRAESESKLPAADAAAAATAAAAAAVVLSFRCRDQIEMNKQTNRQTNNSIPRAMQSANVLSLR